MNRSNSQTCLNRCELLLQSFSLSKLNQLTINFKDSPHFQSDKFSSFMWKVGKKTCRSLKYMFKENTKVQINEQLVMTIPFKKQQSFEAQKSYIVWLNAENKEVASINFDITAWTSQYQDISHEFKYNNIKGVLKIKVKRIQLAEIDVQQQEQQQQPSIILSFMNDSEKNKSMMIQNRSLMLSQSNVKGNQQFITEIKDLKAQISDLKYVNNKLKNDRGLLHSQNEELKKTIQKLKNQFKKTEEKYEQLLLQYQKLRKQHEVKLLQNQKIIEQLQREKKNEAKNSQMFRSMNQKNESKGQEQKEQNWMLGQFSSIIQQPNKQIFPLPPIKKDPSNTNIIKQQSKQDKQKIKQLLKRIKSLETINNNLTEQLHSKSVQYKKISQNESEQKKKLNTKITKQFMLKVSQLERQNLQATEKIQEFKNLQIKQQNELKKLQQTLQSLRSRQARQSAQNKQLLKQKTQFITQLQRTIQNNKIQLRNGQKQQIKMCQKYSKDAHRWKQQNDTISFENEELKSKIKTLQQQVINFQQQSYTIKKNPSQQIFNRQRQIIDEYSKMIDKVKLQANSSMLAKNRQLQSLQAEIRKLQDKLFDEETKQKKLRQQNYNKQKENKEKLLQVEKKLNEQIHYLKQTKNQLKSLQKKYEDCRTEMHYMQKRCNNLQTKKPENNASVFESIINTINQQKKSLRKCLDQEKQVNQQLREELRRLKGKCWEKKTHEGLKKQQMQQKFELQTTKAKLLQQQSELTHCKEQISKLMQMIEEKNKVIQRSKKQKNSLINKIEQLEEAISSLNRQLILKSNNYESIIDKQVQYINLIEEKVNILTIQNEDMFQQCAKNQQTLQSTLNSTIQQLQNQKIKLHNQITDMKQHYQNMSQIIFQDKIQIQQLQRQIKYSTQSLTSKDDKIKTLQKNIQVVSKQMEQLFEINKRQCNEKAKLQNLLLQHQKKAFQNSLTIKEKSEMYKQLSTMNEKMQQKINEIEGCNQVLQRQNKYFQGYINQLQKIIETLRQELRQVKYHYSARQQWSLRQQIQQDRIYKQHDIDQQADYIRQQQRASEQLSLYEQKIQQLIQTKEKLAHENEKIKIQLIKYESRGQLIAKYEQEITELGGKLIQAEKKIQKLLEIKESENNNKKNQKQQEIDILTSEVSKLLQKNQHLQELLNQQKDNLTIKTLKNLLQHKDKEIQRFQKDLQKYKNAGNYKVNSQQAQSSRFQSVIKNDQKPQKIFKKYGKSSYLREYNPKVQKNVRQYDISYNLGQVNEFQQQPSNQRIVYQI